MPVVRRLLSSEYLLRHRTHRTTETMYVFALLFVTAVLAEETHYPSNILNLYRELNCKPTLDHKQRPLSFDCQSAVESRVKNHCIYKGRSYGLSERIEWNQTDPCFGSCICQMNGNEASFTCSTVDCPGNWSPLQNDCVFLYSRDECCSVGTYCPNSHEPRHKCTYEGQVYYEGERFYPQGTCKKCFCKPGFNGQLVEPFCEDVSCNIELRSRNYYSENCAPVYYGHDGCCPISWKCPPAPTAKILHANTSATTDAKCKFGNLTLRQHDMLQDDDVICECVFPPYLTCFLP